MSCTIVNNLPLDCQSIVQLHPIAKLAWGVVKLGYSVSTLDLLKLTMPDMISI